MAAIAAAAAPTAGRITDALGAWRRRGLHGKIALPFIRPFAVHPAANGASSAQHSRRQQFLKYIPAFRTTKL